MLSAIADALETMERDHGVRVLYAAESGSRAWGFASPDSDYDVRFVYVHPLEWYLGIHEQRDVIEAMLPGDLDLSGWDLRKTLRLFAKCNLALNEWLGSPIVYRDTHAFTASLRRLLPDYFRSTQAMFHYLSMARSTYSEHLAGDRVRIKKIFYFLRPILACRWIEHTQQQPPTEFATLVAAAWVNADEQQMIAELMAAKQHAKEAHPYAVGPALRSWMTAQLAHAERVAPTLATPSSRDVDALDQLFLRVLQP